MRLRLPCVAMLMATAVACSNDMETVQLFDHQMLPEQRINKAVVTRSEHGLVQMRLEAPLVERYGEPNPKVEYPEGVTIFFYDDSSQLKAFLRANYAVSLETKHRMEARDSVVIIDYRSGDTSYLEDIVWLQYEQRIFSEHPLRSVNGTRVTYGDGFESDESFTNLTIMHQRGTIEWQEE